MKLSKELQEDVARLRENLNRALSQAPKKELNELVWLLAVDHLLLKDAKETDAILSKFHKLGV